MSTAEAPRRRRAIPRELRQAVIDRDGLVCQLCRRGVVLGGDPNADDAFNLDHIVQVALGGPGTLENLRVVCADCNRRRPKPVTEQEAEARRRRRPIEAAKRARRREVAAMQDPEVRAALAKKAIAAAALSSRGRRMFR